MATLATLRRAVGSKTGMTWDSSGTDRDLIDSWVNKAVREILSRTHCHVKCADLTLTSGVWKYDLPASMIAIRSIIDTESNLVHQITLDELLEFRRSSTESTANLRVAIEGSNLMVVWPTPTSDIELDVFYVPLPVELSNDADDPSSATHGRIPLEFHHAIELWALAEASDHEHEGRSEQGIKYLAQFDEYLKRAMLPGVNRKGGPLPKARVGRTARTVSSRNDTWPA